MNRSLFLIVSFSAAFLTVRAQIQVSEEPRHHKVFENLWVRILDVHILPGDTSLFHKHTTPSVFLVLSNTKAGSEVIVEPEKLDLTPGNVWFEGFYTKPRIHRVWNSDTADFHVIDMELPNPTPRIIDSPLVDKYLVKLFDEKPVRGYRCTLPQGTDIQIPKRETPIVVIGLSNNSGKVMVNAKSFLKKGDYSFVPARKEIHLVNAGTSQQEFAIFELK